MNGVPAVMVASEPEQLPDEPMSEETLAETKALADTIVAQPATNVVEAQADTPDVPMRAEERKRLYWKGKLCSSSRRTLCHCLILMNEKIWLLSPRLATSWVTFFEASLPCELIAR